MGQSVRAKTNSFRPPVYKPGKYTVRAVTPDGARRAARNDAGDDNGPQRRAELRSCHDCRFSPPRPWKRRPNPGAHTATASAPMTEPLTPFSDLLGFDDTVVVVTGAANGIGEATARRFAQLGAHLVLVDIDEEALERVTSSLPLADAVAIDITAETAPAAIVDRARKLGSLDVLVNAAGIFPHHATLELPWDEWDAVMALNLRATFTLAQASAQLMVDQQRGSIVNVASASATQPRPGMAAYAASKGGIISLTRALARDLGPQVRVNAVSPGPITDTTGARRGLPSGDAAAAAAIAAYGDQLPLGRTGRADEVARLIVFLASEAASYITGEVVAIDGGRSLG